MKDIKNKTITSLIWRFAERCGTQGIGFVVSLILARLLTPDAYGTVALMTVFISILNVFIDSGLGNAIVQKKDADELDYKTVFTFNMGMCTALYLILFFASPYIAAFYDDMSMTAPLRVLGLVLISAGFRAMQQAYVSKNLQFKKFFYSTLGATVISAIAGISMAYMGFGVWAIVIQSVTNSFMGTIILFITVKWKPKFGFSFIRFKGLFSFGSKLLASSLIDTVYNNIRQLIIGKLYTTKDLAYYNKGSSFPNLLVANISSSIDSVLLPVMSTEQDNKNAVKAMTRRAMCTGSYIMWPMMMGMMAIAEPLIRLLLTDKWISCVPYLRIFCFTYAFWPMHTANLNAIKAMGRSDMFLKLEIIKKIIGITVLIITMRYGVMVMAYSLLVTTITSSFINASPNKKLMNYSYFEQIKDVMPSFLISAFMTVVVYFIGFIKINDLLLIAIQIITGGLIYIGLSALFKIESFIYLFDILKNIKKRK